MNFRTVEKVSPSGVSFEIRNLLGGDQETLSKTKSEKDISQFNIMLADCLVSVGNDKDIDVTKVEQLLTNDRKYILVQLRQHTLRYKQEFKFVYEWPLTSGNHDKDRQDYLVNYDEKSFPCIPYYWVQEEIEKIKTDPKHKSHNKDYDHIKDGFPKMFDTYAEVLKLMNVEGKLKESKREYQWRMMDGIMEKTFSDMDISDTTSSTPLLARRVKVGEKVKSGDHKGDIIWTEFNPSVEDLLEVEEIRYDIRIKEGSIDTSLTIRNQNDSRKEVRVDLTALEAFFFPSQAL